MLLTHGARSVLNRATQMKRVGQPLNHLQRWVFDLSERRGHNKAACAFSGNQSVSVEVNNAYTLWKETSRSVHWDEKVTSTEQDPVYRKLHDDLRGLIRTMFSDYLKGGTQNAGE